MKDQKELWSQIASQMPLSYFPDKVTKSWEILACGLEVQLMQETRGRTLINQQATCKESLGLSHYIGKWAYS